MATKPRVTRKWIELDYNTAGSLRAEDIYYNQSTTVKEVLDAAVINSGFPPDEDNIPIWSSSTGENTVRDSGMYFNDTGSLTLDTHSIPNDYIVYNAITYAPFIPIIGSNTISGDLIPVNGDEYDLGEDGICWDNIYTNNLHTKNIFATSAVFLYTENIGLSANYAVLNTNETGAPSENAGVKVNRGTSTDSIVNWNEATDKWEAGIEGSTENIVLTSDLQPLTTNITTNATDISAINAFIANGWSGTFNTSAANLTVTVVSGLITDVS